MSISISIYDFFAYTIPGFLYLFIGNEIMKLLGFASFDYSKLDNLGLLVILTGLAFIVGHIFDSIENSFWRSFDNFINRLRKNKIKHASDMALNLTRSNYPMLDIRFESNQWGVLQQSITFTNPQLSERLDRLKATSIMLKNFSFGLVLSSILQIIYFFNYKYDFHFLVSSFAFFFFALVALNRSKTFNVWFYTSIFEEALRFGKTTESVLKSASSLIRSENKNKKRKAKKHSL